MKLSFPFQLIVFIVILLNSAFAQSRFKEYSPKNPANYGHYGNKMVSVDSFLFVRSYEQRDTFFLQNGTLRIINSGAIVVYKVKPNGTLEHYQNLLPDSAYYDAGLPLGMTTNNGSVLATYRKNRLDSLLTYEGVRMVEFKLINNKWAQVSEVKLPKRKSYNSQMGVVLDAEGNLAVVGDWWEDFDENGQDSQLHAGAVYIYEKVNDNWEFQKKLVSNDRKRGSSFGGAVAIHKGRIFSSAINWAVKDPTSSGFIGGVGKVYVYENITGNWVEVDTILSPTPFVSAQFGVQLCFDNNELFVSEPNSRLDSNGVRRDSNAIGAVHIFELDVNGKYTHKQRLQPKQLETFLYFGNSISKKGNQLIVGAPGRDIFNGSIRTHYSVGSVYRYYYANGKYKEIEELALPASLRESEDFFGDEVQIIGDILVVAAWAKDSTNNGNQVLNRMGKIYTTNIPTKTYLDTVHLCNNETFMGWHFDKPQQLTFPFVSKSYTDSIVHFTILPEWNIIDTSINVCYEYTSPISGKTWKQSGFYTDTIHRPGACDSVFRITLNVLDQTRTLKRKACDSFITSSGKVYYSSGTYVDKYQNQLGCDSFIVWDLTINKSSLARIAVFDCYQYTMPSKKYTVYESGVYVDTIKTKRGCDSILTVVVTIPPRRPDTTHIKGCGAYYVPSGKLQMTKSGFYYDTLRTHYGCDSLALIDFEQQQTSSLFTLKACLETFSPSGKYFYTQSGRYYDTMLNKAGCDSFMTIDLVLFDTFITNVETAFCDSFISPLGRVYKSNAEFTEILESQSGCDSTLHFNLTSNGFSASILEQTGYLESDVLADEYQWLECGSNKGKVLATDAKFVPDFSSSFKLAVKKNNCWDTTECLPFYTAGVYPNPTTGQILLSFGAEVENCQVIIIDPLGREINFLQLGNMEHQWIDLPQQSGMYVLHITGNNIEPLLEKVLVVRK